MPLSSHARKTTQDRYILSYIRDNRNTHETHTHTVMKAMKAFPFVPSGN